MEAAAAQDFSLLALFLKADFIVKAVMIGLIGASVWSWAVAIDKFLQVRALEEGARRTESRTAEGEMVEPEGRSDAPRDAMARVLAAGMGEWRGLRRLPTPPTELQMARAQERADRIMGAAISREMARAERGLGVLATIGTSAPFIGLFGTVWGIMNAFRGIAASRDTNLAIVAPGIAEALFATALGLVAAIPAVIFYNKIAGDLDRFATRLEVFTDDFLARMSRRLSEDS